MRTTEGCGDKVIPTPPTARTSEDEGRGTGTSRTTIALVIEGGLERIGTKARRTTAGGAAHAVQTLTERGTHTTTKMQTDLANANGALPNPHRDPTPTLPAVLLSP